MDYLAIVIITFISGVVGTGLGGVIGAVLKRDSNKIVSLLLSFAAGIMLAVVSFDLMSEPIEMMNAGTLPSWTPLIVVGAIVVGYGVGDTVKVTDGPLEGFLGTVDELDPAKDRVRVIVSMFGRETPVDLELDQIEPVKED